MKRFALFLIEIYRKFSTLTPPRCRFYPTCSQYAYTAIERFGFFKGGFLALKRILRCHPFCKGGIDLVPEKNKEREI
jgi:hypothetical protein